MNPTTIILLVAGLALLVSVLVALMPAGILVFGGPRGERAERKPKEKKDIPFVPFL